MWAGSIDRRPRWGQGSRSGHGLVVIWHNGARLARPQFVSSTRGPRRDCAGLAGPPRGRVNGLALPKLQSRVKLIKGFISHFRITSDDQEHRV